MLNGASMRQGLYETESPQGEITGKGFPDHDEFADRRENANSATILQTSYPGGSDPNNLHIIPGELSFGSRESHVYNTNGEPNEHGFTSLNGKNLAPYRSDIEVAMRNHYFQGVVKTEYIVGSQEQAEGGYSFLRAGSCSIVNNGHGDIYAGDLLEWYFPTLEDNLGNPDRPVGTSSAIAYRNRGGEPFTKIMPQVRRYNPYQNESSIDAIIRKAREIGYTNRRDAERSLNTSGSGYERMDTITEEATGVLLALDYLGVNRDVLDNEDGRKGLNYLMGALASAQKARKDRVFAKSMSTAGPSETVHVMVSHFSLI